MAILEQFVQLILGTIPASSQLFFEIGVILIIATLFGFLVRFFNQPLIPAYIIAGIIIGPLVFNLISNQELILSLAEIGITFLIFTAGMEIQFSKLREVGISVFFIGLLQVSLSFLLGFFVSYLLVLPTITGVYIGLVVAFSSTLVIVKILVDKHQINSVHGRLIVGILLLQDVVAISALSMLGSDFSVGGFAFLLVKAAVFVISSLLVAQISPPIFRYAARYPELLLLASISLLFMFSIGAFLTELPIVIGAFFAGLILANSTYKTEIEGKIIPLRDFFAVLFFVALGMQLRLVSYYSFALLFVLLILVIICKPLVTMFLVRIFGYNKRTSFLTGNALAQTSEFSFILVTIGLTLGHLSEDIFSALILLTILTMSLTTYFIRYERNLMHFLSWPLNLFKNYYSLADITYGNPKQSKILLFGCHRMGSLILSELASEKKNLLVVDYNPDIIRSLAAKKIPCVYGDFTNPEVLDRVQLKHAEMIISTVPDVEDNLELIRHVRSANQKALIFIVAERISEALRLYKAGADYVILPKVAGGITASQIVKVVNSNKSLAKQLKKEHQEYLRSIHRILY